VIDPELLALATPEERRAIEAAAKRETALLSPLDLLIHVDPSAKRFAHTELINRYFVAHVEHRVYEWGIGVPAVWTPDPDDPEDGKWLNPESGEEAVEIVVVSAPPQHGKSYITTETGPAWYIAKFPDRRVILTGYEANFAKGFSEKNRNKIEEAKLSGLSIDPDHRAAGDWRLLGHPSGGVISAGSGGPITGKGAHLMVIDDPVKNSEDALSETQRRKNWDWWLSTVKSRMRNDGVIFVIQTRWHEDDLAGRIIKNEKVFYLNIPALAFEGHADADGVARDPETGERDPLGRSPGAALCPALHTKSKLEGRRDRADGGNDDDGPGGALWFSCLYQGKPTILGAGILPGPYLRYEARRDGEHVLYSLTTKSGVKKEATSKEMIRFGTVDLAASTKTRADWTVFAYWGFTHDGDLLLLDITRSRMESPDHEEKLRLWWARVQAEHGKGRFAGIENKTFGMSLIQSLMRSGGMPVRPLEADTDKVARALAHAGPWLAAGRVYIPRTGWADEFKKECQAFDTGTHDDQVDVFAYAASQASMLPRRRLKEPDKPKTTQDRIREKLENRFKVKKHHPVLGRL
jgi:predicted phage terminase large subunit-like protein